MQVLSTGPRDCFPVLGGKMVIAKTSPYIHIIKDLCTYIKLSDII